jgi:hypothetical protein
VKIAAASAALFKKTKGRTPWRPALRKTRYARVS